MVLIRRDTELKAVSLRLFYMPKEFSPQLLSVFILLLATKSDCVMSLTPLLSDSKFIVIPGDFATPYHKALAVLCLCQSYVLCYKK